MGGRTGESEKAMSQHPPPNNASSRKESQAEFKYESDRGAIFLDPETAHSRVGDPGYTTRVEGCNSCRAAALANEEAGIPSPQVGGQW